MATILRKGTLLSRWNLEWQQFKQSYWLEHQPSVYYSEPPFPTFLDTFQVTCDIQLHTLTNAKRECGKILFFGSMWDNRGSRDTIPEDKRSLISARLQDKNYSGFFSVHNDKYEVYLLDPAAVLEHIQRTPWRADLQWNDAPLIEWHGAHADIHVRHSHAYIG